MHLAEFSVLKGVQLIIDKLCLYWRLVGPGTAKRLDAVRGYFPNTPIIPRRAVPEMYITIINFIHYHNYLR